jgi:iron complex transport system permease protein
MANNRCPEGKRALFWLPASLALLLLFAALSFCLGAVSIRPGELIDVLFGKADPQSAAYRIVMFVRLPRVLAAMLAGSALAVAGAILQAVLNNALASPNIIGVNSGAGLFALLSMAVFPNDLSLLPVAAFYGALLAALLVYCIAMKTGASRITIVLAGVAVGTVLSAGINAVTILHPDTVVGASSFMMGGLSGVNAGSIGFAAPYIRQGLRRQCCFRTI